MIKGEPEVLKRKKKKQLGAVGADSTDRLADRATVAIDKIRETRTKMIIVEGEDLIKVKW